MSTGWENVGMIIAKPKNDKANMLETDAQSRITVWTANHLDSVEISKIGLTSIPCGAANESGTKILHASGPGLTLERRDTVMPQGLLPYQGWMLPTMAQAPQQIGYAVPLSIPQFSAVPPHEIQQSISEMTGGYDPVYVAEELGLFQRDMDEVSGPKLCRCFCESNCFFVGKFNFPCFDAEGNFKNHLVLSGSAVFEVKCFKYTRLPDVCGLLFAPSVSAVYTPVKCDGIFTTDANLACANFSMDMGWLCTAGGKEKLDWEIIRRFGENARLVWTEFADDPLLTCNQFVEAFGIVTEARRHGIEMNIVRAKAVTEASGIAVQAQESLLDSGKIKKVARRYNLPIDPVWNDLPGEIDFDDDLPVHKVLPFWTNNRVAVFFGMRTGEFLVEIIRRRPRSAMFRHSLVVVDKIDRKLMEQVHAAGGNKIRVATFDVFKDEDVFLTTVPSLAKMIFIVPPCGDSEMKVVTPEILNVCAQAELPVGIFSRSEDAPQQETASDTVLYNVVKSKAAEDVFSVKNMNSKAIVKYEFSPVGVEETPGTEEDMRQGE